MNCFSAMLSLTMGLARPETVEHFVQDLIDQGEIPGAVVYVTRNREVLLHAAFGYRDKSKQLPMQTETICWGASIMKPVTVATFMTLVEAGKVGLDDQVEDYLPQFAQQRGPNNKRYPITIHQLMTHSSGLSDPVSRIRIWPRYSALHPTWLREELPDIVDAIAESRLRYPPGTDVRYSNAGFFVLARIAEERFSTCRCRRDRSLPGNRYTVPTFDFHQVIATKPRLQRDFQILHRHSRPRPLYPLCTKCRAIPIRRLFSQLTLPSLPSVSSPSSRKARPLFSRPLRLSSSAAFMPCKNSVHCLA